MVRNDFKLFVQACLLVLIFIGNDFSIFTVFDEKCENIILGRWCVLEVYQIIRGFTKFIMDNSQVWYLLIRDFINNIHVSSICSNENYFYLYSSMALFYISLLDLLKFDIRIIIRYFIGKDCRILSFYIATISFL